MRPILLALLENIEKRRLRSGVYDLLIVGGGLLGSTLAFAAVKLGKRVLLVSSEWGSTSFKHGESFALNTWNQIPQDLDLPRLDQHPGFDLDWRSLRDDQFLPGDCLFDAGLYTLARSGASLRRGTVVSIRPSSGGLERVSVKQKNTAVAHFDARAVIVCTGLIEPVTDGLDASSSAFIRKSLQRRGNRSNIVGFQSLLARSLGKRAIFSKKEAVAVVGGGPSALSVLERLWQCWPSSTRVRFTQPIVWFLGSLSLDTGLLSETPRSGFVSTMLWSRYAVLRQTIRRAQSVGMLTAVPTRVRRVTQGARQLALADSAGASYACRYLVWCGGMKANLSLLGPDPEFVVDKVLGKTALRAPNRLLFGVSSGLDAEGFGEADTGPFADWYAKAISLLGLF